MQAQKLYKELMQTEEKSRYKVLAHLFSIVFERKMRNNEWGFLRKLRKLYGAEVVFWAMLSSSSINADKNPLRYVSSVCANMLKEELGASKTRPNANLDRILNYMRNYQKPDWGNEQDANGEAAKT